MPSWTEPATGTAPISTRSPLSTPVRSGDRFGVVVQNVSGHIVAATPAAEDILWS
jgi:hypothetical protein